MVLVETYPEGSTDFSTILAKVRAANPDVLGGATFFGDAVAITRQMKALNVNPRMYGLTVGVDLPKFYEALGRDAEFVYGASSWLPELVELRAGGLIPIARQYPGAREFVESYKKEFPGVDLSFASAVGYGGCRFSSRPSGAPGRWTAGAPRRHFKNGPPHCFRRIPGRSGWSPDRAQEGDISSAGRQEGDRVARGAGAREGALPHAAVEPTTVSHAGKLAPWPSSSRWPGRPRPARRLSRRSGSARRSRSPAPMLRSGRTSTAATSCPSST